MTRTYVILPLVASALIVAAVVVSLWMIGSASGERDRFSSLEFAPRDADVFVAINTDPTSPQWLAVNDSLNDINAADPIREALDEALAEFGLDWEDDILPVAGDEAYFSVPDITEVEENAGWVAGVRLADTGKARDVFEAVREQREDEGEDPYEEEEYEGVTIYYEAAPVFNGVPSCGENGECTEPDETVEDVSALAIVEDVLAFAATRDGVKSVIDVVQGREPSAEENERLQDFRRYQREDFLVWGYADLEDVWDLAEENLPDEPDSSRCAPIADGVQGCIGEAPETPPDLVAVSEFMTFITDGPTNVSITLPLDEPADDSDRIGFFTHDGDGGWSRAAEVTLDDAGTLATADFRPLPDNLVVLRDDSEPRVTQAPIPATEPDTDLRITSFDAEYTVADGLLQVTERIAVDFGDAPKHGIFRDIPEQIDYDFEFDQRIYLAGETTVLRDGVAEPFEVIANTPDDFARIRIGDPNVEITGAHLYEIRYAVTGAIRVSTGSDPYYEVVWDVTGDGWPVPIETASATFTSAEGSIVYASCFVGEDPTGIFNIALDADCAIEQSEDDRFVSFQPIGPVEPGEGVGLLIGVEAESGAPEPDLIPDDNFDGIPFDEPDFEPEPEQDPLEQLPFDLREVLDELRGTYDRVGFALTSFDEGFAFDVNVAHAPGFEPEQRWEPTQPYDSQLAALVPADTMFFLSYFDLYGQSWLPAKEQLDDFEFADGEVLDDILGEFMDETGLDLEDDVLALLTGEIAFAGNVSDWDSGPDFEGFAIADVNDEDHALSTMEDLENYLEDAGAINVDVDGDVHIWESLESFDQEPFGWSVHDGRIIFGYPDDLVAGAGSRDSLAGTIDWQRTMDLLPDEKTFVGFVSIARIIEELRATDYEDEFGDSTGDEITLEDLEAIRSIGFAGTARDDGFGFHVVLFMEDR